MAVPLSRSTRSNWLRWMATAQIELPKKLIPVFAGKADVRGAHGGRGSAKTRSFAKMAAVRGYIYGNQGIRG